MTILERQHPEEYGQRTNVVVSGDRRIVFAHHAERLGRGDERPALASGPSVSGSSTN